MIMHTAAETPFTCKNLCSYLQGDDWLVVAIQQREILICHIVGISSPGLVAADCIREMHNIKNSAWKEHSRYFKVPGTALQIKAL